LFTYVGLQSESTTSAIKGNTPLTLTGFSTTPSAAPGARFPALVADGQFIVIGNAWYSLNNGASWTVWGSQGGQLNYQQRVPSNLNGIIAYNPTAKRAFSIDFSYVGKINSYQAKVVSLDYATQTTVVASVNTGSGTNVYNVIYSPALNAVYMTALGTTYTQNMVVSASNGGNIGGASTNSPGAYRYGLSNDGYLLGASYAGFGTTFYLRKYTDFALATYTQFGTISVYITTMNTGYIWCPVNNKYFIAAAGGTTTIYSATSDSPQNIGQVGTFTVSGFSYAATIGLLEDASGILYVFGQYFFNQPKGGAQPSQFLYSSSDGGVTWTNRGIPIFSLTKNFTV
jgi:hypothetical protein